MWVGALQADTALVQGLGQGGACVGPQEATPWPSTVLSVWKQNVVALRCWVGARSVSDEDCTV